MPNSIVDYLAIFSFITTAIGFLIRVITHRPTDEVLYEVIHHSTSLQTQSPSHPQNNSASSNLAEVYPSTTTESSSTTVATRRTLTRSWRHFISHPWLFGIFLLGLLLSIGSVILAGANNTSSAIGITGLFGSLFYFVALISSIVIAAKERKWIWLVAIILTFGYAGIFYSIFDRAKKPAVASSIGTAEPSLPSVS